MKTMRKEHSSKVRDAALDILRRRREADRPLPADAESFMDGFRSGAIWYAYKLETASRRKNDDEA